MSNAYAATPPNAMRSDALAGVRTRRILAVCIDFVLVSFLVVALWIVSIVLTFGLALLFLPPLWPIVAFFYNGL
ncbi:MAG: RDD family protein, partial [Hyphomicrobiales bacterium]|nr:RDD family protein [Hyphomicrobiales bacterium]